jgi:hypothetical protein
MSIQAATALSEQSEALVEDYRQWLDPSPPPARIAPPHFAAVRARTPARPVIQQHLGRTYTRRSGPRPRR